MSLSAEYIAMHSNKLQYVREGGMAVVFLRVEESKRLLRAIFGNGVAMVRMKLRAVVNWVTKVSETGIFARNFVVLKNGGGISD